MNNQELTINEQQLINPQVFFKQPATWSRAIVWTLISLTTCGIAWASVAKIEKVIPATGKLEPKGAVKEIQASVNGVVDKVYVKDGERVEKGDLLLEFEPTALKAQIKSNKQVKESLVRENNFYRQQIKQYMLLNLANLDLSPEIALLLKNKHTIMAETELYQALATDDFSANLNEQQARWQAAQSDRNSRILSVEQEVKQLEWQLQQTKNQQSNARKLVITAQDRLATAKNNLITEQAIASHMSPLVAQGVVSNLQYLRQKQEIGQSQMEMQAQQQEVTTKLGEIESLKQEQGRLQSAIAQAQANLTNTIAAFNLDLQNKIAANQQRVAEIDSQLGKQIMANDRQIAELDSKINSDEQNLKYHRLKSPVAGTIFELKAHDGFVAQPSKPLLEIVPDDSLIAQVYILSKDRGFVKSGMDVDVRIDSFDFTEFGNIAGKLIWVGADALEPDQQHPFPRYPAKIKLARQTIMANGKSMALESGMAINVNIKERKRRVISVFSGFVTKKLDTLQKAK
ncbi:hemolysin D [Pleurocapsa sp. CCALA 161]|uniref:HlyD family efflux transporter periplasmic adaptor subunit n=1 Tax=Pleurocapsa sp. CCALA 161 TaxID=2107688 RepID=UPI000D06C8A6|nr:HlyD family efflux transporter periplasmic adaptor subunit [Pleurocapsa sp. CCALA 161]PSB07551.1 hemolysin D [Pleurocapsa sp. CCALA 161]